MNGLRFFFLDEGEIKEPQKPSAYCLGGYMFEGNILELHSIVTAAKQSVGLEVWMPIKWNFDRRMEDFYRMYLRSNNFHQAWQNIKKRSHFIRKNFLLHILQHTELKLFFSVTLFKSEDEKNQSLEWTITNLFQRIGLNVSSELINIVMCDFMHPKDIRKKLLESAWFNAFYKGQGYFSGSLEQLGVFPAISYSSTLINPFLQIADLIVGGLTDLIKTWLRNEAPKELMRELFPSLYQHFVANPKTKRIGRYGFVFGGRERNWHYISFGNYLKNHGLLNTES